MHEEVEDHGRADARRINGELGRQSNIAPVAPDTLSLTDSNALRELLGRLDGQVIIDRLRLANLFGIAVPLQSLGESIALTTATALRRRGHELRLVYASPDTSSSDPDPRLVAVLAKGWTAWDELATSRPSNPVTRRHLARLARLRFLASDITLAILHGRQPVELTARTLLRIGDLPVEWQAQRTALGFARNPA